MSADRPVSGPRLVLIAATPASLRAELEGAGALALHLGVSLAGDWPPDLYDRAAIEWGLALLESDPEAAGWGPYHFAVEAGDRPAVLIGVGGYKGRPDQAGEVEIGYSIVPSHQGQGLATAAAESLVQRAFVAPEVRAVIGQTLPSLPASIRVLEKVGFRYDGEGDEPGVIRFILQRE